MSRELLQMVFTAMSGNAEDRESARLAVKAVLEEQPAPVQEPVGEAHLMQEGFTHCIWSEAYVPVGTKFYTTPPARPAPEFVCSTGLCHYKAVPDAFGTYEGEHPEYIQGWNDCRAEMLAEMSRGRKP
jgi:hypothetical protein